MLNFTTNEGSELIFLNELRAICMCSVAKSEKKIQRTFELKFLSARLQTLQFYYVLIRINSRYKKKYVNLLKCVFLAQVIQFSGSCSYSADPSLASVPSLFSLLSSLLNINTYSAVKYKSVILQ